MDTLSAVDVRPDVVIAEVASTEGRDATRVWSVTLEGEDVSAITVKIAAPHRSNRVLPWFRRKEKARHGGAVRPSYS